MKSALVLLFAGCSSWNTGSSADQSGELACLDTCEAIARASERCGLEYKRSYDAILKAVAKGDCKNVLTVRDEPSLRQTCLPSLSTEICTKVIAGDYDPSCSRQLQRAQ